VGTTPSTRRKHIDGFVSNFGHALPLEKEASTHSHARTVWIFESSPHSLHEPWSLPFFILETKRRCDNEESETARKTRDLYTLSTLVPSLACTRDILFFCTWTHNHMHFEPHHTHIAHIIKIRLSFLSSPRTHPHHHCPPFLLSYP
jgi:hypothetical protein